MATPLPYISKPYYVLGLLGLGVSLALLPMELLQGVIWFMNAELMNLLHFPAFFLLAHLIPRSQLSSTGCIVMWLLVPVFIELCQWWVGRTCDVVDAVWGVWALGGGVIWRKSQLYLRMIVLMPYCLSLTQFIMVHIYPLWHLPTVSNMEDRFLVAQISNVGAVENTIQIKWVKSKGSSVLSLAKQSSPWTGIRVAYPWGIDTGPYKGLKFEMKSGTAPLEIDIKVADLHSSQIKTKTIPSTNWTEVSVEFDKSDQIIDWNHIDHFAVYYVTKHGPQLVEIDSLKFY